MAATTRFESVAFSLITPPNFGSGGGSWLPLMVVVALGEPGTPVVWICALAVTTAAAKVAIHAKDRAALAGFISIYFLCLLSGSVG